MSDLDTDAIVAAIDAGFADLIHAIETESTNAIKAAFYVRLHEAFREDDHTTMRGAESLAATITGRPNPNEPLGE